MKRVKREAAEEALHRRSGSCSDPACWIGEHFSTSDVTIIPCTKHAEWSLAEFAENMPPPTEPVITEKTEVCHEAAGAVSVQNHAGAKWCAGGECGGQPHHHHERGIRERLVSPCEHYEEIEVADGAKDYRGHARAINCVECSRKIFAEPVLALIDAYMERERASRHRAEAAGAMQAATMYWQSLNTLYDLRAELIEKRLR